MNRSTACPKRGTRRSVAESTAEGKSNKRFRLAANSHVEWQNKKGTLTALATYSYSPFFSHIAAPLYSSFKHPRISLTISTLPNPISPVTPASMNNNLNLTFPTTTFNPKNYTKPKLHDTKRKLIIEHLTRAAFPLNAIRVKMKQSARANERSHSPNIYPVQRYNISFPKSSLSVRWQPFNSSIVEVTSSSLERLEYIIIHVAFDVLKSHTRSIGSAVWRGVPREIERGSRVSRPSY